MRDFPIVSQDEPAFSERNARCSKFKALLYSSLRESETKNKIIFVLNSEIYSSYYVLGEGSQEKRVSSLPNVSVLKVDGIGKRDMK